jgi:plasmid stability protein
VATLQVKGIDDDLYRALAARASSDNRSISQEVVTIIADFLARPGRPAREATEAFLALCGSWDDPRPAEQIVREARRLRRFGRRRMAGNGVLD